MKAGQYSLQIYWILLFAERIDLLDKTLALECQGVFGLGHGKILGTLEVVENWQAVKSEFLGFREDGQSLVRVTAHDLLAVNVVKTLTLQINSPLDGHAFCWEGNLPAFGIHLRVGCAYSKVVANNDRTIGLMHFC